VQTLKSEIINGITVQIIDLDEPDPEIDPHFPVFAENIYRYRVVWIDRVGKERNRREAPKFGKAQELFDEWCRLARVRRK
jgi:hypothetical protein